MVSVPLSERSGYFVNKQLFLLLFLLGSATLSLVRFNDIPVGSFFDDAHYIVLAEGLADGQGYRLVNYPAAPVEMAFPPGWPLLLTPLAALLPANLGAFKLAAFFFWLASLPLIYRLAAAWLPTPWPGVLLLLTAFNPHLIAMSGTVMSEAAYLFFSLLTLNLLLAWQPAVGQRKLLLLAAALATAVITLFIRTIGITLLAAVLLVVLVNGRRRSRLIVLGLLGLGLLPLVWFNAQHGGLGIFSPLYTSHVTYVASRLGEMLLFWRHLDGFALAVAANVVLPLLDLASVTAVLTPVGVQLISLAVLLLVLSGWALSGNQAPAPALYFLLYAGVVYVWSVYIGAMQPRILLPVIPFMYVFGGMAVIRLIDRIGPNRRKVARHLFASVAVLLLLANLARNYHDWQHPVRERIVDLSVGNSWLQQHTAADAIVMTPNPVPDYLYARRLTVDYPTPESEIGQAVREQNVDYVLIRPLLQDWHNPNRELPAYVTAELLPYLNNHPEQFEQVYWNQKENVTIFKVSAAEDPK